MNKIEIFFIKNITFDQWKEERDILIEKKFPKNVQEFQK